jgi:4-alpha-glucanotransferase
LGIPTAALRIQRMPSTAGVEFDDPLSYPYMAVASPSSHDTTPLRAWFKEDPARQERFQHFLVERGYLHDDDSTAKLSETGAKPAGNKDADAQTSVPELVSTVDLVKAVIQQHLESPCVLAIFPLQDIMALSPSLSQRAAEEETINNPADPEHYWRYRMHVNIEDLGQDEVLTAILPEMLLVSGRIQKHEFDVTDGQIVTNGGI